METRKSLLLSAGVVAITALLATTNAFAQLSCTSKTTGETAGAFTVNVVASTNVDPLTQSKRTTYTYTLTGNATKVFIYVQKALGLGDFKAKVDSTFLSPVPLVQAHSAFSGSGIRASDIWKVNHHENGVLFPAIPTLHTFTLDVPERFKPEEGLTTILLGKKSGSESKSGKDDDDSTYEHCGPILGPTTLAAPTFLGSPLVSTVSRKTFENGCVYDVIAGSTDNIVVSMTPVTPFGTNPPTEACTVTNTSNICQTDLGLAFCPPGELGRPPLQSVSGGICYYPPNLKFKC